MNQGMKDYIPEPKNDFGRDLRVADFVRDELAQIIQQQMRDPRVGMISINDVKVSRDLSFADVYVSSMWILAESDETAKSKAKTEMIQVLNKAAGFLRTKLSKRHSMRTTPVPRFHYDDVAERAPKMDALIKDALAADDRQRGDGTDG